MAAAESVLAKSCGPQTAYAAVQHHTQSAYAAGQHHTQSAVLFTSHDNAELVVIAHAPFPQCQRITMEVKV